MVAIKDLESLKKLAAIFVVPFFAAASIADGTFTSTCEAVMPPLLWIARSFDPVLTKLVIGCFVVVIVVFALVVVVTVLIVLLDNWLESIPVVGNYLTLLIVVSLACITAELPVLAFVIKDVPPSPLNPFWHLGLLCYGVALIEFGAKLRSK